MSGGKCKIHVNFKMKLETWGKFLSEAVPSGPQDNVHLFTSSPWVILE